MWAAPLTKEQEEQRTKGKLEELRRWAEEGAKKANSIAEFVKSHTCDKCGQCPPIPPWMQ